MTDFDKFKDAIFGQESGNGAVDTSTPNYAGAIGKGQIVKATFDGLKRQGKIPATAVWTNPKDNEAAAEVYMKEAWDSVGGDPSLAAAYYYGGPKAVKGGSIVLYRDTKNASAPSTLEYASQVVARMGGASVAPVADAATHRSAISEELGRAAIIHPRDEQGVITRLAGISQGLSQYREDTTPTEWEAFSAAVNGNGMVRLYKGFMDNVWADKFPAEPGYQPDLKALPQGSPPDLVEDYYAAKSPQEADDVLGKYNADLNRRSVAGMGGAGVGFARNIGAELLTNPINVLAGVGVGAGLARAGYGSLALANSGRYGEAVASSVAENVISGSVVEAATQAVEGQFNGADLLVNLAADALLGAGAGGLAVRGASVSAAERLTNLAAISAIEREVGLARRAEAQIGSNASVGDLRKVMNQLETEDINGVIRGALADVPIERQLIKAQADAPAVGQPLDVDSVPMPTSKFATAEDLAQREVDLAKGGRFEAEWTINTNGIINNAEEFTKLGKGVHVLGTVPRDVAGSVETLTKLSKAFLPDHTVTLLFDRIPQNGQFVNGAVVQTGRNGAMIRIDPTLAPSQVIRSTAHEIGHVIFNSNLSKAKIKNLRGVTNAWREFVAEAAGSSIDGNKARGMRFSALNVDQGASKEFTPKLSSAYELDFDEYLAEQFVKYMEKSVATDNKFGLSSTVVNTIKDALARVMAFFKKFNRELPTVDSRVDSFLDDVLARVQESVGETPVRSRAGGPSQASVQVFYRGVGEKFSETKRQDIEWWADNKEHAQKYASRFGNEGAVVKAEIDTTGFRVVPESKYAMDVLDSAFTANEPGVRVVDDSGKTVLIASFTKPPVMQADMAVPAKPAEVVNEVMTDPATAKFGMTTVPISTAAERKQAQAMLALHKQAAEWETRNPMDEAWNKRVQNLSDNNVFNVASTGLLMLKSPSPLVRMIASELLEDASGVAGKRQATAAISKYMTERFMLGNAINDVQGAYAFWKKGKPGGLKDDLIGGNNWAAFNKEVAAEIEARRLAKGPVSSDPNIKAAADTLEAAYQRTANAQRNANTLGSEGLPETSVGYMPHRMSPKAVMNLTNEQTRILHDSLTDQFVTIEGWDASFADQLASAYVKRVRDRASGDYGSNIGGSNPGANSLVEEALRGMDLPEETIRKHMDKFAKGGANFTKGRIDLDLNKVYATSDGEFKLLDIFETNQLELLRSQAGRASGEVALTKFGVRGKPGLKLLRDAMAYGEDGKKAGVKEKEAFDQMAAEFLNEPFGTQAGKFMERAMAANTLVRLGGIAFNQIAESINGIVHVGVAGAMNSVASIPRLRGEIKALARGEKVDNPFLTSIELAGGAEFGTDAYKIVMPFDSPDHAFPTYGQDTLTLTDRLLRGGGHLQSKLSGWRMIHSAQQRGMAEQIVQKMARYIREGKDDIALEQFGINANVRAALRGELNNIAKFDGSGNLLEFDVTKISDPDIREQVIQSVWRGTSQIIQGTFIGERGKWAHDGWLKLMTQFRTFSVTSMEKQWGRQRNSRGAIAAFCMLVGTMFMAVPIYMARVYANSIGRPDQEEFIEERLQPAAVARATLNYVAMSGMAGDFIDLTSSLLPEEMGVIPTGGRAGVETEFVGNYVLPASSLVNDIWKYAQSPMELDDAARVLPMSRLPYLVPLTNATRD